MRIRELVLIAGWAVAAVAATPDTRGAVITVRVRNTAEVPPPGLATSQSGGKADLPRGRSRDGVAPVPTRLGRRRARAGL